MFCSGKHNNTLRTYSFLGAVGGNLDTGERASSVLRPLHFITVAASFPVTAQRWVEAPARATEAVEAIQQNVLFEMRRHNYSDKMFRIDRGAPIILIHFSQFESRRLKADFERGQTMRT